MTFRQVHPVQLSQLLVIAFLHLVAPKGAVFFPSVAKGFCSFVDFLVLFSGFLHAMYSCFSLLFRQAVEVQQFVVIHVVVKPSTSFLLCIVYNEVDLPSPLLSLVWRPTL